MAWPSRYGRHMGVPGHNLEEDQLELVNMGASNSAIQQDGRGGRSSAGEATASLLGDASGLSSENILAGQPTRIAQQARGSFARAAAASPAILLYSAVAGAHVYELELVLLQVMPRHSHVPSVP